MPAKISPDKVGRNHDIVSIFLPFLGIFYVLIDFFSVFSFICLFPLFTPFHSRWREKQNKKCAYFCSSRLIRLKLLDKIFILAFLVYLAPKSSNIFLDLKSYIHGYSIAIFSTLYFNLRDIDTGEKL